MIGKGSIDTGADFVKALVFGVVRVQSARLRNLSCTGSAQILVNSTSGCFR